MVKECIFINILIKRKLRGGESKKILYSIKITEIKTKIAKLYKNQKQKQNKKNHKKYKRQKKKKNPTILQVQM